MPVARKDRAETSLTSKPRFGPQKLTEVLRVLEIRVVVMLSHLPVGVTAWDMGVEGVVEFFCICIMRQIRADFGHMSGYPESL